MPFKPQVQPKPKRLVWKRMTIAAGIFCDGAVVFGADTEESVGALRRRVHKIPSITHPPTMITGSCDNSNLMDTAIERIFDTAKSQKPKTEAAFKALLQKTMTGLYANEFSVYPDRQCLGLRLLVAALPFSEKKVSAWSIDASAVRRMHSPYEIVGTGEYVYSVAEQIVGRDMRIESAKIAMSLLVSIAKKRVQYVGGATSCFHVRHYGTSYVLLSSK